jgi:hypothetical protein
MSNLQTTQIKITVPDELYFFLKSKADKFGLSMASYIRNLAINDVKDMDMPVFKMSEKAEKIALKAIEDYKNGKIRKIDDIDKYLNAI